MASSDGTTTFTLRGGIGTGGSGGSGELSPFGKGGVATGGPAHQAAATAWCSGGAGSLNGYASGKGGPGFLRIFPLPDIGRFARVLATIEKLSSEQASDSGNKPPPAAQKSNAKTS